MGNPGSAPVHVTSSASVDKTMSDVIMSGETGKLKFLAESRGILGHSGEIMPENTKYISYENYKKK